MEKIPVNNNGKYAETEFYKKLDNLHPECHDFLFSSLVKVARSEKCVESILYYIDVLLEYAANKKDPDIQEKFVEVTVEGIFPILTEKNPNDIKPLLSSEYKSIIENLEEIGKISDEPTAIKCVAGKEILTF